MIVLLLTMMSCKKIFFLFLFVILNAFFRPTFGVNSSTILVDIEPYLRIYQNGTVQRLRDTEFVPPSLDPRSRVLSKDVIFEPTQNLSGRLFRPNSTAAASKLPLFIYFHGGGFMTQSPFSPAYFPYIKYVAAKANVVALSVNYRLAPEHHLPVAYQDGLQALKWAFSHSKGGKGEEAWLRDNVNFNRVYVGGDSAGGNIAHNVAMRAGSEGITVRGMFLNCPHFWGGIRIGNESDYGPQMVELESLEWTLAYPNSTGLDDPQVNPTLDPNLSKLGVKKVLVYVAENDILRDRGLEYVKALGKSGWKGVVKGVEVKGVGHVFNIGSNSTKAKRMMGHMAFFLNDKGILH